MVDPHNITKYDRSDAELQELVLFTVAVAGKTAVIISSKLNQFFRKAKSKITKHSPNSEVPTTPFGLIRELDRIGKLTRRNELKAVMKSVKLGKYLLLVKAFRTLANDFDKPACNLRICTVEDLERVPGIGRKTSRFFILHTRPNQQLAVLNTHVLRYLRDLGIDAPMSTPASSRIYKRLEALFIEMARFHRISIADFDLDIWRRYTKTKPLSSPLPYE